MSVLLVFLFMALIALTLVCEAMFYADEQQS